MPWISYLSNPDYYIHFDEACIYCGDTIVAEISSAKHRQILEYFADRPTYWHTTNDIIEALWDGPASLNENTFYVTMAKLKGIHPELRKSIASKKGSGYHYLGQKRMYVEPAPKSTYPPSPQKAESVAAPTYPPFDPSAVQTATYYELLQHGYTGSSIAAALVQNDYKLYHIAPENEGDAAQWQEYLTAFPETFQYIVDKNSWAIVGNFSFLSVTDAQAEQILSGTFLEKDLHPAITRDLYSAGSDHILFLLNMSINEEYGTARNYTMLRNLFLEQLHRYAEDDIYFKTIITNVYRGNHEAFYKEWGFEYVTDHCYTGKIYSLQMFPYPEKLYLQLRNNSKLRDINERLKEKYDAQHQLLSVDSGK